MNYDSCALIIPSTVHVSASPTALVDPEERNRQYIDSISFFITKSPLTKIIVCDNSGFRYSESLYDLALGCNKELELLSFQGNKERVAEYGKGYGEGEIMRYVLSDSSLIKKVGGFLKVTGRLKVVNISRVLRHCDHTANYFNPISLLRPRFIVPKAARYCVDTRVYYVTKEFFSKTLLNSYQKVRDKETFFLEHAYHQAMANSDTTVKCFPVAPEITGMSGSNGWIIKERGILKKTLIMLASKLGFVKPIYRR